MLDFLGEAPSNPPADGGFDIFDSNPIETKEAPKDPLVDMLEQSPQIPVSQKPVEARAADPVPALPQVDPIPKTTPVVEQKPAHVTP